MKVVSTTLCNSSGVENAKKALASIIDHVDHCIVVWTDDTECWRSLMTSNKIIMEFTSWNQDFSSMRQQCLEIAKKFDASWAFTLDSDERYIPESEDLRSFLFSQPEKVAACKMQHVCGSYSKERAFRIPARGAWTGPTHEYFDTKGEWARFPNARFDEIEKSGKDLEKKCQRDIELLKSYVVSHPTEPRWFYYLGESLRIVQSFEDARKAFESCYVLDGWNEESSFACYKASNCSLFLDDKKACLDWAIKGIQRHPGIAENFWMAGVASLKMRKVLDAIEYANHAIMCGAFMGRASEINRVGFRYVPALFEAPFDVLVKCNQILYKNFKDDMYRQRISTYTKLYEQALSKRTS